MSSGFKRGVEEEVKLENSMMLGENGHPCFTAEGLGSSLLALFDRHFQGISEQDLRNGIRQILIDSRTVEPQDGLSLIVNLFVMCWHTRWCRGGKGAKLPFYQSLKILYEEFPIPVIRLLPLIPEFGYWKDLLLLSQHIKDFPVPDVDYSPLQSAIWDVYSHQLLLDYQKLQDYQKKKGRKYEDDEETEGIPLTLSCAGKYAPREKKHFDVSLHAVSELCKRMFSSTESTSQPPITAATATATATASSKPRDEDNDDDDDDDMVLIDHEEIEIIEQAKASSSSSLVLEENERPKKRYREMISSLNRALDVPEVKMCANRFSTINLAAVPSRCMSKNQAAFANDLVKGGPDLETGNRHPDNADRVKCRQNLLKVLSAKGKGVKGAQCYPHEYVEQVLANPSSLSLTNKLVINSQWKSMRESIEEMVQKRKETILLNETLSDSLSEVKVSTTASPPSADGTTSALSLGHLVPLSDVSGSMSGTPMSVAIGLGILCSELVDESFRDLVMTFSGDARWEDLSDCKSFVDKVIKLKKAHWEGNTNFYNALNQVALVVRKNKLKQEEIPNLLVISDMQFDSASGLRSSHSYSYGFGSSSSHIPTSRGSDWNTIYENIEKLYSQLGIEICGSPYTPPVIIFWNVRADTVSGFPVSGDQKGVVMLNGYSPALMKFILSGEFEKEVIEEVVVEASVGEVKGDGGEGGGDEKKDEEDGTVMLIKKRKVAVSPMDVMMKVLAEEKFNSVREVLYDPSVVTHLKVGEGSLLQKQSPYYTSTVGAGGRGGGKEGRGGGRGRGVIAGRGGRGRGRGRGRF
jgi:hypothetical protein